MAHQSQLESKKYRNWVKAGLGLKYTKEGLEPFCDQLVKQQHGDILNKVKQKHNLSAVSCGHCDIKTLQPDHVRTRTKQCPLGQGNCNCQHPGGKTGCPNNVCGAIYDKIIQLHASTPPHPCWKNTDAKHWCTEPWAVAKCFINAVGYETKLKASDVDCPGLIHVLINNMDFRDHLSCTTDGSELLQKVIQYRNNIYHSHDMELEDNDVNTYIDAMIAVLQDGKELINTEESKSAVDKLRELKRDDFVITTTSEAEIRRAVMTDIKQFTEEVDKRKHELEKTGNEVGAQVARIGTKQKTDLENKWKEVGAQVANEGTKLKSDLEQKGKEVCDQVVTTGTKQKTYLEQKGKEVSDKVTGIGTKQKTDLEQKGKEVCHQVAGVGTKQKTDVEKKGKEVCAQVADIGKKQITDLEQKGKVVSDEVVCIGTKQKTDLEQQGKEISCQVANIGTKQKTDVEQKGKKVLDQVVNIGKKQKTDIEQKGKEVGDKVANMGTKQKIDLEQKGKEVGDQIVNIGTKQKTDLEQKESKVMENITMEATKIKVELEQKQKEGIDELMEKKTKLNIELEQRVKGYPTKGHNSDYNSKKAEYQKKLMQNYMQYALQVSALPLQPESNHTGIENVYVSPWMTVDIWDENSSRTIEVPISVDEMFHNVEKPARNIYVLGEAGSGKTTFCKMLVYYWCVAHTEREAMASECSAVKVTEDYDFLFYVSLRHNSDLNKLEIMLNKIYPDPVLRMILQNESDKCLILLDGLDEWTAQNQQTSQFLTSGLPTRDLHAKYTIITTTRRWKFDTLRIKDSEIDKKIKLKGIRGVAVEELTKKTVRTLNKTFHKNKVSNDFLPALEKSPVADVSHVPMILQQLICLWFDDRLRGNSKCAIYSSMLDLFFDWNALKLLKNQKVLLHMEREFLSRLPEYLNEYRACLDNTNTIYHLSHLAYKTLFGRHKENTLTFSNSNILQLNIPDDVITFSLKVGILSEDQNKNLFASRRQHTSFSFVHKTLQEFLAAVYVAIQFEKMIQSLDDKQKGRYVSLEYCKQFVRDHFGDCKTVADILEQSNILIMLCGVESQLLPFINEYIYTITTADEQITEERTITNDDIFGHKHMVKIDIQKCIVSCVSEALSSGNQFKNNVYIADIVLDPRNDVHVVSYLHRQIFNLHHVLSVDIDLSYTSSNRDKENMFSVLKIVTECDSLKTVKYRNNIFLSSTLSWAADICIERTEQQIAEIIARNISTLETVSFMKASERMVKDLVQSMPTMCHVTSFRLLYVTVSHEVCRSLCTILEQSVHLQQIWLDINCNKRDKHSINLTKHKQLKYLDLRHGSICASSVNTERLETCRLDVRSSLVVCESMYNARWLKHLALHGRSAKWYYVARTETDCLVRLLPTLTSLITVELSLFAFTDNIITHPSNMKNLQEVELRCVIMNMETWCGFVDSLPALPQTVCVRTLRMEIGDIRSTLYSEDTRYLLGRRDEAVLEAAPEALETAPEALEAAPEALEAAPEALETAPEALEAAPEALEAAPEALEAAPEALETAPEALEAAPEALEAAPEALETALEAEREAEREAREAREEARQYIRKKPESFCVTEDNEGLFFFVTKEAEL